ncbi:hypothetical protein RMHFA_04286 [Roseomonas mucosa]|uniref:Uncharacterized protein n=1 Tax=Roseomonas mucosa TaxID=207340 RepID=A0A4Y1N163_9PROT|nr:hypothetical protein RADP37_04286 [Roseomonas mucosa]QDD95854.1 hypothetical protein HVIM_04286 [Roseomonas mucosa]QDE00854.1 hypothetical protein ADP8_04286 [Roseomonas mucosa]UZO93144.1 hypothetical protein RMP42_04286 [Roseomonas mucosa]UZO97885.1 hypothetical protein RMHFA_04286 [Roseomonas mucosa]
MGAAGPLCPLAALASGTVPAVEPQPVPSACQEAETTKALPPAVGPEAVPF